MFYKLSSLLLQFSAFFRSVNRFLSTIFIHCYYDVFLDIFAAFLTPYLVHQKT